MKWIILLRALLSFLICLIFSKIRLELLRLWSLRFAVANLPLFQLVSRPHFITPDSRYQMLHSVTIFPPLSFLNCIDSTHIHNIHCLTCLSYTRLYFVIVEWMVFGVLCYSILYEMNGYFCANDNESVLRVCTCFIVAVCFCWNRSQYYCCYNNISWWHTLSVLVKQFTL